ncbi:MAG TPA: hypothetical protein GXX55_05780 [Firmicutes bacterium]|nr:hypothetical protein [Bacillota bacterium]
MARHRYSEIKTEFVRRELRRTRWKNRDYIHTLMLVEDLYAQGGPKHWPEGMGLRAISQRYPMAVHAIRSELIDGKVLSDEELRAWLAERRREEERRRKEWEEEHRRRREQEREDERLDREEWLQAGGLP